MLPVPTFTTLGDGPTVVLLHDADGGHLTFAPQVETLANAGYRAVAWNMPGYGNSAPVEPVNRQSLAQRCVALVEALHLRSVVLVGHGLGGMVALEVALRRPALVRRLALCGTPACWTSEQQHRWAAPRLHALANGVDMAQHAAAWVPPATGPGALPEGVRLATHAMAQLRPSAYRHALQALEGFDRSAVLAQLAMPTLLVGGAHDGFAPPAALGAMAARIPDCRHIELPGAGHWPQLEAPDDFDQVLLAFLAERRVLH